MQVAEKLYTYTIITKDQPDLIEKAAACLARTFVGVDVAGKWVQEPMVGYLNLLYEDLYQFTKDYLENFVDQGYCAVALDSSNNVAGALVGDTNALEIIGEDVFKGSFSDMNIILHALEDVDNRFLNDFKIRYGKEMEDGDILHLFLLGVIAEHNRYEIVQQLGDILITKASEQGLKLVLAEATNPKSIRVMEKYHNIKKYVDCDGNYIVHKYQENPYLNIIPTTVADGTYIIVKEL